MSLFGKKQSAPVRPLAAHNCEYVTMKGESCWGTAKHKCYRCSIRVCGSHSNTCEYENAQQRATRKYCFDCVYELNEHYRTGRTEFVDVQPISLDAYSVDMPVRRPGPVKWED